MFSSLRISSSSSASSSVMSKYSLMVLLLSLMHVSAVSAGNGTRDWTKAGFPTMNFFFGLTLVGAACFIGFRRGGHTGIMSNLSLFVLHIFLFFFAIFMGFGPGSSSNAPEAKSTILSILLFIQVAVAMFVIFTHHTGARNALLALSFYMLTATLGLIPQLGHGSPAWALDEPTCVHYFARTHGDPDDWVRCLGDGYLQMLRVLGFFTMMFEVYIVSILYLSWSDNGLLPLASQAAGSSRKGDKRGSQPSQPYVIDGAGVGSNTYQNMET